MKVRKVNRGRRALVHTLPAPTGGLNGRDNLLHMAPTDAFVLDNAFPASTSVDTRGGSLNFSTGIPGAVESLEVYTGAAGSKMLAFGAGNIYNVTLGGAVGAAIASGKTSNKTTSIMFSNAGAQFLLIFSGSDQPLSFDGTTLAGLTITGLTGSQNTLQGGMAFKGRVFLAQQGQLGFYYLGIGAIQGAASYFDLQQQSVKGGSLACITSYSQESGIGPQDYAVFATTEGEYIVYNGTDPSNAATWILVGRYFGPPPIGRKGFFRFRSDVYFITEEGILSLTQIRQLGDDGSGKGGGDGEDPRTSYLTAKLGRQYTDTLKYQATHGWCGLIYPRSGQLVINVPLTGATNGAYQQFVMNTSTNAWCTFSKWNALCWALFNRRAYFGTFDGRVVLADEGVADNGAAVQSSCRQAWNTFEDNYGMGEANKQYHAATFSVRADGAPAISCTVNVNFQNERPSGSTPLGVPSGAAWDTATWDVDDWAGEPDTEQVTIDVGKIGYVASIWMTASSLASKVEWFATRVVFEKLKEVPLQ